MTRNSLPHADTIKDLAESLRYDALSNLTDGDEAPLAFAIEVLGTLSPHGTQVIVMLSALRVGDDIKIDLKRARMRSRRSFERRFGFSFEVTISQQMTTLLVFYESGLLDHSLLRPATRRSEE